MPLNISTPSLNALLASQTSEVFAVLLTITTQYEDTICLTNNNENITTSTATYRAFPFDIIFPNNVEGQISSCRLVVDNASRELICAIRNLTEPFKIRIQLIRYSAPDDVVREWNNFRVINASYTINTLSFTLSLQQILAEPFPSGLYTPSGFRGLF